MSNENATKNVAPALDREAVDQLIASRPETVSFEEKAGWFKLEANGNRIYIAKQKKVRHVHLSGFGAGLENTVPPPTKNGAVQAHLDVSVPDALENLKQLISALPTLPPVTKPVKAPKPAKVKTESDAAESIKTERLARLKNRAAEVSQAAMAVLGTEEPASEE